MARRTRWRGICLRPPKRPRDINEWAKRMVDIARGEVVDREPTPEEQGKDPVAVARGRLDSGAPASCRLLQTGPLPARARARLRPPFAIRAAPQLTTARRSASLGAPPRRHGRS